MFAQYQVLRYPKPTRCPLAPPPPLLPSKCKTLLGFFHPCQQTIWLRLEELLILLRRPTGRVVDPKEGTLRTSEDRSKFESQDGVLSMEEVGVRASQTTPVIGRPSHLGLEAIAIRLEAIASRLEASATSVLQPLLGARCVRGAQAHEDLRREAVRVAGRHRRLLKKRRNGRSRAVPAPEKRCA